MKNYFELLAVVQNPRPELQIDYIFPLIFVIYFFQVLFSGSTISLFCKANGIPAPEIHWMFNGTNTKKTGEDYVIANADKWKDSGLYMCVASNQVAYTK